MRKTDWHERYVKFIHEQRYIPFAWGENDCGKNWVIAHVRNITDGERKLPKVGAYKTMRGALKEMKSLGGDNLADILSIYFEETPVAFAQIGDIAAIPDDTDFGYVMGIVNGDRIFVKREDGLGTVDLLEATRAFKV